MNRLRFDTGRVCLDLLATVGGRLSSNPVERLTGPARLADWLDRAGVHPGAVPDDVDDVLLRDFQALRSRLHRILHTDVLGEQVGDSDLTQLNRVASAGGPPVLLARDASGAWRRRLVEPPRPEQLLAAVAADAIDLLGSPVRADLRECEGETCDLLYLDTSRGRRRRWCSAAACGNRHHVASLRARRQTQG
ncbi:CGNR zinc finger domain-containing protein [Streptomyces sp. NRRL F-5126]|uniref:CGNR zinc finger domain-containing protein n=1 Tax=Streptomyces sp. NRRL F-5126 TaxID=1463857 RepID=UPI002D21CA30|nr:ABATE domain-containing protein [Streptomyces sp. NRRL F-5126]